MPGEEASILALSDGITAIDLVSSQDHKPVFDGDKGPNTGGMGAYAPAPVVTPEVLKKVYDRILYPTIDGMRKKRTPFIGCLYVGLMIKDGEPKVVEYNVRFGDPEIQPVLSLLNSDLYTLLRACAVGNLDKHKVKNNPGASCCVVMASENYPGTPKKGDVISGLEEAAKVPGVYVFHAGTKLNKQKEYITDGGRVLGVTGTGANIREAIATAYKGVGCISWEGEQHRNDIGAKAVRR
jgi:phosphoribosylamine--glycine ligase